MVPNDFVYQTRRALLLDTCTEHLVEETAHEVLVAPVAVDEQAALLA